MAAAVEWNLLYKNMYAICNMFVLCVLATIRSTVDACDITDHDLGKLIAGLLEVRIAVYWLGFSLKRNC